MFLFIFLSQDDDLEEGEVKDPSDRKIRPRPICRFFIKGANELRILELKSNKPHILGSLTLAASSQAAVYTFYLKFKKYRKKENLF